MFDIAFRWIDETQKLAEAVHRGLVRSLRIAAYKIFSTARGEIEISSTPSAPGQPPHSRSGQLPRAIRYDVDERGELAVIGPQASQVGDVAEAFEHEGSQQFRRQTYPEREFMGPALAANAQFIPGLFAGTVEHRGEAGGLRGEHQNVSAYPSSLKPQD